MESTTTTSTAAAHLQLEQMESTPDMYRAPGAQGYVIYSPDLNAWVVAGPVEYDSDDDAAQALLAAPLAAPAELAAATDADLEQLEGSATMYQVTNGAQLLGFAIYSPDLNAWVIASPVEYDDEDAAAQGLAAQA